MKKTIQSIFFAFSLLAIMTGGCALLSTPAPAADTAVPSPVFLPTQTPIREIWDEIKLVTADNPLEYPNPTDNYESAPIYQGNLSLEKDTRWLFDLETGKLKEDIGEASTGLLITGSNDQGDQPVLFFVYQKGGWNLGYAPVSAPDFTFGNYFQELKSPVQQFQLSITEGGKILKISNQEGFTYTHTFSEPMFARAKKINTFIQVGPQSTLRVNTLTLQQKQDGIMTAQIPTPQPAGSMYQYIFHVSPEGKDSNPGTQAAPFASLERARDGIRLINHAMSGDILVVLHGGVYPVLQAIQLGVADSGQNGHQIIYRAAEGEQPVFSGGMTFGNWEALPGNQIWKSSLPPETQLFRQLYINGRRSQRAVFKTTLTGLRNAPGEHSEQDGIVIAAGKLPALARPQDLELHWIYDWKDMRLPARGMDANPDGSQTLWLLQPYYSSALAMGSPNHQWIPGFDRPFYLENALEFLDQPGEWYYNAETHELFYWPLPGEEMKTAETVIPQAQSLLELAGGPLGQEVHDLVFEGLTFAYAGWTRASKVGTFGWQAQSLISGDHEEMTPAHIHLSAAHDIRFEKNQFIHLGASALGLGNNTQNITVRGNLFHDISDAAIVVGHWDDAYIRAPLLQAQPKDNFILDNRINQAGVEYWGASGINAYYVENLQIVHNELSNLPYTGISLGWGWSSTTDSTTCRDNRVAYNLITDLSQRARDAGGIYTLGQQPGTVVEGNVIRRMKGDYACLYPDEGSAFITYRDNVCDTAPFWLHLWINTIHDIEIQNTYSNVAGKLNRGVNIHIANTVIVNGQNWPPEAGTILKQAGLEPGYEYLQDWLKKFDVP